MTVQLNWPPELVNQLTEEARENGLSLNDYLLQTVLHQKESKSAPTADEAEKRRKRTEAGARILEIQKRVKADPEGWTSRDYIRFGRH